MRTSTASCDRCGEDIPLDSLAMPVTFYDKWGSPTLFDLCKSCTESVVSYCKGIE